MASTPDIRHDPLTRRRLLSVAAAGTVAMTSSLVLTGTGPAGAATGQTYYLSPSGDDKADGRSENGAWRTVSRANGARLLPGDRLLLRGQATFTGMLYLDAADAGDAARPVVIGSYGTGRATLVSTGDSAVLIYNTAGVHVRDLVVVGGGNAYRTKGGISFYADRAGRALTGVTVSGVEVRGFRNGVEIGSATAPGGFRTVRVTGCLLRDNMESGLAVYGPAFGATSPAYAHEDVTVDGVSACRNLGDPTNTIRNTGSGIVLGSVRGGRVTRSQAYENGSACSAPEGPVGIWTYDSTRVVIERCLSYRNRTGGTADGGGFDLDQNVSDSVLQHNLSYENDGYGYLVYTARDNAAHRGNVVRYNISQSDVRTTDWYGGITVVGHGPVHSTQIYQNTVVSSVRGSVRPAPITVEGRLSAVTVRNNVFVSVGTGRVVSCPTALPTGAVLFQGNAYQAVGSWAVRWGTVHTGLAGWRTASGQERSGGSATGLAGDARLVDPTSPVTVTDPALLTSVGGFRLRADSPLLRRGLDLASLGSAPGSRDYFGNALPAPMTTTDVGAHQLSR